MRNLYSSFAAPTLVKQLKQTVGQASMRFAKMLLVTMFMITAASVKLFAQPPVISYSSPQTYTINSTISALTPASSGGAVAAPGYSSTLTSVGQGFSGQTSIAVDAAGNVYEVLSSHNAIKEYPVGGGTGMLIGTGLSDPYSAAIDAAGNVFVADAGDNAVKKIPAGGGATVTIASGSFSPTGIAVDRAGNIYFADNTHGNIDEIPAGSTTPVTLGTGFNSAGGIAVDGAGNVYAADPVNRVVKMIPVGGGSPVVIGSGFNQPYSVAVDGSGNVYVTDLGNNSVTMIPAGGGTPVALALITSPSGIAIGATGIIYVSNQAGAPPKEIKPVGGYFISPFLPVGLTFNNATGGISGTPTAASPATNYTVTAYNSSGSGQATVNIKVLTNNTNLTNLVVNTATLTPSFATGTKSYTASVGNTVASITVTPTTGDGAATITVNGTTVASGSASPAIPLSFGANTITVAVTDGAVTDTYTITVTRPGITIATLSNLTISSGTLSPAFATDTSDYTVLVTNATTSVTVTPTTTNATATVTVNGTTVASGSASPALPLVVGDNSITTVVTAQDGVTTDTYAITVTRPPSGLSLSYSSPQSYITGTAVTLAPTSSGVAAYGYSASAVTFASGFNAPMGLATDAAGNVFVADHGNKLVKRIPAGGGTPTTIGSGFTGPTGVAVDPAGNIWVTDSGDLKEVPAGGGAIVTTPIGDAVDVAVDKQGNVFVLATSDGFGSVTEYAVGGGAGILISSDDNNMDTGIAIDGLGNIFVSFQAPIPDINQIEEIANAAGYNTGGYNNLGAGLNAPTGVAVDGIGNVFVADGGFTGIVEYPVSGAHQLTVSSGLNMPNGVALDGAGNIYVSDAGTNTVKEIKAVGGYFISPGLPAGLNFDENTGIISGTPTAVSPATNYTVTAHNSSGSTFATLNITVNNAYPSPAISYSSPQTYTVGTAITPLTPTNSGGTVLAQAYSNTLVNVGSGFDAPTAVAVDAAGNVYICDSGNNEIKKYPVGGGGPVIIGSGFNSPAGVAIDAAGNVYVSDGENNAVKKVPAGGGSTVTIATGFFFPSSLTLDAAGNVYVADMGNHAIKKIPAGGGATITIASGLNSPTGVAVDAVGNVYFADQGANDVMEIPAAGGTPVTIGSGFKLPYGVYVDAANNIYVADYGNKAVKELPAGGGAQVILGSSLQGPTGVAIGLTGNLYVADQTSNTVRVYNPIGGYFISAVLPAGLSFSSSTGTISGTPTVVSPAKNYTVTAYNSSGSSAATVNIEVTSSSLTNLALSSGTLSPTFATGTTSYTAPVPATTTSITETPTSLDPSATITVNGTTVASGTASASIPLSVGPNTITTVVTAAGGTGTKTYTVTAGRGSSDALLTSIQLTPATTLTIVSGSSYVNYTGQVPASTSSITVTATEQDATATITVNGTPVASGTASPSIPLSIGNNVINIVSTAQNGVTSKTYTINLARGSSDALLTSIHLTPTYPLTIVSGPSYVNYTTSVPHSTTSVTVTSTTQDATATIAVNGTAVASGVASPSIPLNVGSNVINIVVTAQNGVTTKTYTITATRAPSSDALLTSIKLAPAANLTIVSGPSYVNYTTSYANSVSSCTVTATEQDATATITVNGTPVASGAASPSIPLTVGSGNVINIVSTAQDGTTTKTYTITVTRAPSSDALLTSIKLAPAANLTIVSGPSYVNYTTSYANSVSSCSVTATEQDATATITVNGTAVASGTASGPIALSVGSGNVINIVSTAQDGTTTKTYTITVTRDAPGPMSDLFQTVSVTKPTDSPVIENDGITVHEGVSPNGDGINDVFTIEGLTAYPQNKVSIIDRNGALVYQAKSYDNQTTAFDGHSNINGKMQLPGTYFYTLDYSVNGQNKHKTGYVILKY